MPQDSAANSNGLTYLETHQVLADGQWAGVSLAGCGRERLDRWRRHDIAGKHYQMGEGCHFWHCLRENIACFCRRSVMVQNTLDIGFVGERRERHRHLMHHQVGTFAVSYDVCI